MKTYQLLAGKEIKEERPALNRPSIEGELLDGASEFLSYHSGIDTLRCSIHGSFHV